MTKELVKDFIWHRAQAIPGFNPDKVRLDYAGAIIHWDEFEKEGAYGWVCLPVQPISKGGNNDFMSLIPWHHQNAKAKNEDFPYYRTVLSSKDGVNVEQSQEWCFMQKL